MTNAPSVATSGTDDSMESVENHFIPDFLLSVPPAAHTSQQRSRSGGYGTEEGYDALSLDDENGSLKSSPSSRALRTIRANKIMLETWMNTPERHEQISFALPTGGHGNLTRLMESLRIILDEADPAVDPQSARIFAPQAGFGSRQLELPKLKVSFAGLPDIPRAVLDKLRTPDPEDNLENITEAHHANFRQSLSNLAVKGPVLAHRLVQQLGPKLGLILPLFDGRGLDALFFSEQNGITEHPRNSKPARSNGSAVPKAKSSTSKGHSQGGSKRSRDKERDDNDNEDEDHNSKRNKKDPAPPTPPSKKVVRRFKCPFRAKCPITHCRKKENFHQTKGFASIHHLLE
jgi:hypothetical protein